MPLVHGSKHASFSLQFTKNLRLIILETTLKDSDSDILAEVWLMFWTSSIILVY
jgi:hypothetical protein